MKINQMLCPPGLRNNPNRLLKYVDFITIHGTGNYNPTATANSHAKYQCNGSGGTQTSWHYTVDKSEIWQSFCDDQECWHAGSSTGNATSIGIEIAVNDRAGFSTACENTAWLTAELLKNHNLTIDKVVQHNYWSGKNCPAELRSGAWGVTWEDFLGMVQKNLAPKEEPLFKPGHIPSEWARESWEWAVSNKITDGTNPQASASREQVIHLMLNYHKKFSK